MTRVTKSSEFPQIRGLTVCVELLGLVISLEEAHGFDFFLKIFSHVALCCLFSLLHSLKLFIVKESPFWPKSAEMNEQREFWKKKKTCIKKVVTGYRPSALPVLMVLMVFSSCLSNWFKSFNMLFLTLSPPLFLLVVIQIVPLREQINACHEN